MSAPASTNLTAIALLMVVVGMGIPLMAAVNAALAQHIASPVAASTILCGVGFVLIGGVLAATGLPQRGAFVGVPLYYYAAGLGFFAYILAITWSAPRIGLGNAVFFVLLGQLVAAAAIDHLGLFGTLRSALTWRRAAGLAVMALGVYFARKPR